MPTSPGMRRRKKQTSAEEVRNVKGEHSIQMMRIGHFSKISLLALGAALPAVAQNTTVTTTPQAAATAAQPPAEEEAIAMWSS